MGCMHVDLWCTWHLYLVMYDLCTGMWIVAEGAGNDGLAESRQKAWSFR